MSLKGNAPMNPDAIRELFTEDPTESQSDRPHTNTGYGRGYGDLYRAQDGTRGLERHRNNMVESMQNTVAAVTGAASSPPVFAGRGKCSVKVGTDHHGRSITLGEPLLRVFRELMQRVNDDMDESAPAPTLRITLNLDDLPPTEEMLSELDAHTRTVDTRWHERDQHIACLEQLLRSLRDIDDKSSLVRVTADYVPHRDKQAQVQIIVSGQTRIHLPEKRLMTDASSRCCRTTIRSTVRMK
jgi:hypothetical protein